MTPTPRVSIGVPVYNGERFLALTLDSLLAQTYRDFEIIIGDNASIDRTEEIGRTYAAKDPRVRYVRHEHNLGLARNYMQPARARARGVVPLGGRGRSLCTRGRPGVCGGSGP